MNNRSKQKKSGLGVKPGPGEIKIRDHKRRWVIIRKQLVVKSRIVGYSRTENGTQTEIFDPPHVFAVEDTVDPVNQQPVYQTVDTTSPIYFNKTSLRSNQAEAYELIEAEIAEAA